MIHDTNKKQLRPSQKKAIEDIWEAFCQGRKKVAFAMMTGGGKTLIACEFIKKIKEQKRVLFVMRGEKLTLQNHKIFQSFFDGGVGKIHRKNKRLAQVSVASIDTILANPSLKKKVQEFYNFVVVDEAHLSTATNYIDFLKGMNDKCLFLGLSATYGLNNKRAHEFWDHFVLGPEGWDLLEEKSIPPLEVYMPKTRFDLKGVQMSGNDYNTEQLFDAINKPVLYGDIIEEYQRLGRGKPAIAFCVNIKHLIQVQRIFVNYNYNVCAFHSKMSSSEKAENNKKLNFFIKHNMNFIIVSVDMLTAGVDIPELEVGLMIRPTKSENKFRQQVGRLTRNNPKSPKNITLIDFTKNSENYGHIYNMLIPVRQTECKKQRSKPMFRCAVCFYLSPKPFEYCPNCGALKMVQERELHIAHDEATKLVKMEPKFMNRDQVKKSIEKILNLY